MTTIVIKQEKQKVIEGLNYIYELTRSAAAPAHAHEEAKAIIQALGEGIQEEPQKDTEES